MPRGLEGQLYLLSPSKHLGKPGKWEGLEAKCTSVRLRLPCSFHSFLVIRGAHTRHTEQRKLLNENVQKKM